MCVCIMCMLSMRDVYNRQKSKKGMTMGEKRRKKRNLKVKVKDRKEKRRK